MQTTRARFFFTLAFAVLSSSGFPLAGGSARADEVELAAGAASADITPSLDPGRKVWLAGHELGRAAEGVHDPLAARALVLSDGNAKVALVAVDLIGLPYTSVKRVRTQLPEFSHVLVASTHVHEAPDVIGIWGPSEGQTGVDAAYIAQVEQGIVDAVRAAQKAIVPARAFYGTASEQKLLRDFRLPNVFDPTLRVLRLVRADNDQNVALLVQWNSHPVEPDNNRQITRDFMGQTRDALAKRYGCEVVYFSGAIGGLMGTPTIRFTDAEGKSKVKNIFDYMHHLGEAVADVAQQAVQTAEPCALVPFVVSATPIAVPMTNRGYRMARAGGVLDRDSRRWTGDPDALGDILPRDDLQSDQAIESEVAYLRLGDVHLAAIPGELYPELVYGECPRTPEPGVDFPEVPHEGAVMEILPGKKTLLLGLANDELGYIIPKRQWDERPPFAYDRPSPQYGERNSLGPDAAGVLLEALRRRVREAQAAVAATP